MRIDGAGIRVEEAAERVLFIERGDRIAHVEIAPVERLADVLRRLAGQLQAQPVVAHRLPPQRVELGRIGRPLGILAVVLPAVVSGEVEDVLAEQVARVLGAFGHAGLVEREDLQRRRDLAIAHRDAHARAQRLEAAHVLAGEEQLARIEVLEITVEDLARHRRVHRPRAVRVAAVRQQAVDQLGRGHLVGARCRRHIRDRVRARHQGKRHGQRQGDHGSGNDAGSFHSGSWKTAAVIMRHAIEPVA